MNGGGLPLRREEECGGSIVLDFMYQTGGNDVWNLVSVASYWLLLTSVSTQSKGVISRFAWQFLSVANYFGVPVVHLKMRFLGRAQVPPTVKVVRDLCPQILHIFELSVN